MRTCVQAKALHLLCRHSCAAQTSDATSALSDALSEAVSGAVSAQPVRCPAPDTSLAVPRQPPQSNNSFPLSGLGINEAIGTGRAN
jgi:hypothetical protein